MNLGFPTLTWSQSRQSTLASTGCRLPYEIWHQIISDAGAEFFYSSNLDPNDRGIGCHIVLQLVQSLVYLRATYPTVNQVVNDLISKNIRPTLLRLLDMNDDPLITTDISRYIHPPSIVARKYLRFHELSDRAMNCFLFNRTRDWSLNHTSRRFYNEWLWSLKHDLWDPNIPRPLLPDICFPTGLDEWAQEHSPTFNAFTRLEDLRVRHLNHVSALPFLNRLSHLHSYCLINDERVEREQATYYALTKWSWSVEWKRHNYGRRSDCDGHVQWCTRRYHVGQLYGNISSARCDMNRYGIQPHTVCCSLLFLGFLAIIIQR